jgi:glucose-1-phosphate cytidylyltransferase
MGKDARPKVVILCGGKGLRLSGSPISLPKPLVEIGRKPILWHLMKIYAYYGFPDFILCLGYKGDEIKEYFAQIAQEGDAADFNIEYVDTGLETQTGGRVKLIEPHIREEHFMLTYADGLADIDIRDLYNFHICKKKIMTMTCVRAFSQFGLAHIDRSGMISSFKQKPPLPTWINGGFFVCHRRVFDTLHKDDTLEERPLQSLIHAHQLCAYQFKGFWVCMDTYKDTITLNDMWNQNQAKWKVW